MLKLLAQMLQFQSELKFALKDKQRMAVKAVLTGEDVYSQMFSSTLAARRGLPWGSDVKLMSPLA